jgi:hypothetical protein
MEQNKDLLVFNIGVHKSGTKSLKEFLKNTNLNVDNNKQWYFNLEYQKDIVLNNNYEVIKEYITKNKKINFFEDSPYNLLEIYKYLNNIFPNSKFILTIRNTESWFNSFLKWCHEKKLYNKKFIALKHTKMYGGKIILENKDLIIKKYEERIRNIKEYFKNTNKLLIIESDNILVNKVKLICNFLNLNYDLYKNITYPHFTHK